MSLNPLESFPYSPISIIVLGFKSEQIHHPLDGFGLLVPEKEKMSILGTFFTSSLFPFRAPDGHITLTAYLGGTRQPELAAATLQQLKSAVMSDLNRLLGVKGEPVYLKHFHWPKAIPQFNVGYAQYLRIIENAENNHPLLSITGNYRTGVAVGNCLLSGLNTAEKIKQAL